jgi:hypothetical protein
LEPNLETATFTGCVDVDVDMAEGVSTITLKAIELAISAASLDVGGRTVVSSAPLLDDQYETAATPQDEQRYLFAPAGTEDVEVAMEVFGRAFGDVRTQDAPYLIGALVRNRVSGPVV